MERFINLSLLAHPVNWLIAFAVWTAAAYLLVHINNNLNLETE